MQEINVRHSSDGHRNLLIIQTPEKFVFSNHRAFRIAYVETDGFTGVIQIDMSRTNYMDSSALGMLLALKEHAKEHNCTVELMNPSEYVQKLLETVRFNELFEIKAPH